MKINLDATKRKILNEIVIAQKKGYVNRIDVVSSNKNGTIIYDPDCASYGCDAINNVIDEPFNTTTLPNFDSMSVYFSSSVNVNSMVKISEYFVQKYSCKCNIVNNRLDVYGFKNAKLA